MHARSAVGAAHVSNATNGDRFCFVTVIVAAHTFMRYGNKGPKPSVDQVRRNLAHHLRHVKNRSRSRLLHGPPAAQPVTAREKRQKKKIAGRVDGLVSTVEWGSPHPRASRGGRVGEAHELGQLVWR